MRVIGAGWGRTGTTSLAAALGRLGVGPCLQMSEMWSHPELVDLWNALHAGATSDWRAALSDWEATVDWPGCWEWREFAELWPDAVIVLSVRDPGDWYASVRQSIHAWTAWHHRHDDSSLGGGLPSGSPATGGFRCAERWEWAYQTSRSLT
jgi:hypothetical protein